MSEYNEQMIYSLMVVWIAAFSFLYGCGGISNKWLRRYLGTAWMMLGIFAFSTWLKNWHNWYLTFYPLAIGGTGLPYGGGGLTVKLRKRLFPGLAFSVAPISLVIINNAWFVWAFHAGICIGACLFIGGLNIFPNPRKNETLIATFCFLLTLFMVTKP